MNNHPTRIPSLLLASLVSLGTAGLLACSTQGEGPTTGNSVLVNGAQHVVWSNLGGGFTPPIPATASCHLDASYDFDLGGGSLSWSVCTIANGDYSNPAAYSTVTGSRVLTADERTQATNAARAVTVSIGTSCGADKPSLTLAVATHAGMTLYGDDFYACQKMYDQYVASSPLDQLGDTLRGMAHNP